MQGNFPPELAATPLEDIDSFYTNRRVICDDVCLSTVRWLTHYLLIPDLRSCQQRQRYFSFFCNRRIMAAWSVQSNSSRSYLYSRSSIVFVIHHHDYPHQLYINDNAVVTNRRVNRVSAFDFLSYPSQSLFNKSIFLLDEDFINTKLTFSDFP